MFQVEERICLTGDSNICEKKKNVLTDKKTLQVMAEIDLSTLCGRTVCLSTSLEKSWGQSKPNIIYLAPSTISDIK